MSVFVSLLKNTEANIYSTFAHFSVAPARKLGWLFATTRIILRFFFFFGLSWLVSFHPKTLIEIAVYIYLPHINFFTFDNDGMKSSKRHLS